MTEEQQLSPGPQTPSTGATYEEELRTARIANRFDIRRIIGGVFLLYGLVLVITGVVGSHEVKTKAAGVNVDLWTGLGMLLLGIFFLVWMRLNPLPAAPPPDGGEAPAEQGRTADH